MTIEEIEFADAVLKLPKNAVKVTLEIESYEEEGIQTLKGEFNPAQIREAFALFEDTVNGDYPTYILTEEGAKYAAKMGGVKYADPH